jgi:antitoxin YefM
MTITASDARARLYALIDETATTHEPISIRGKRHEAVLVAESDWRAIQETLYLLSIPKLRESIRKGLKTPLAQCSAKPGW